MKKLLLLLLLVSSNLFAQERTDDMYFIPKEIPRLQATIQAESIVGMSKSVGMHFVIDFSTYKKLGSMDSCKKSVDNLTLQMQKAYNADSVSVYQAGLTVFNTQDPFNGDLVTFSNWVKSTNPYGDIFILLSNSYSGGVGWVGGITTPDKMFRCAVAQYAEPVKPWPQYTFALECAIHEFGHVFGSNHTHACVWNGNNTPIDGCGPAAGYSEGTCTAGPYPPLTVYGTIMSYCHLNVGIDLKLGFGPQPRTLIRTNIAIAAPMLVNGDTIVGKGPAVDPCSLKPSVTPLITINSSDTSVLYLNQVSFNAIATGAGSAPKYTWYVNGSVFGGNSSQLNMTMLNKITVSCQLYNPDTCVTTHFAMSNSITVSLKDTTTKPVEPCVHQAHFQTFIRSTAITTTVVDSADLTDHAKSRMIMLVNLDSMSAEFLNYTGQVIRFTKGIGRYSMTNYKTCDNGQTVSGYAVQFQVTGFAGPTQIFTTVNTTTVFITVPAMAGYKYQYRWKYSTSNSWSSGVSLTNSFKITGLTANTKIDIQVAYQDVSKNMISPYTQTSVTTQDVILLNFRAVTEVSGGGAAEFDCNTYCSMIVLRTYAKDGTLKSTRYSAAKVGSNHIPLITFLKSGDMVKLEGYFGHTYTVTVK